MNESADLYEALGDDWIRQRHWEDMIGGLHIELTYCNRIISRSARTYRAQADELVRRESQSRAIRIIHRLLGPYPYVLPLQVAWVISHIPTTLPVHARSGHPRNIARLILSEATFFLRRALECMRLLLWTIALHALEVDLPLCDYTPDQEGIRARVPCRMGSGLASSQACLRRPSSSKWLHQPFARRSSMPPKGWVYSNLT